MKSRSKRKEERSRRLALLDPEHQQREIGWRMLEGTIELWFSACPDDTHGKYRASCSHCNIGEWVSVDRQ